MIGWIGLHVSHRNRHNVHLVEKLDQSIYLNKDPHVKYPKLTQILLPPYLSAMVNTQQPKTAP